MDENGRSGTPRLSDIGEREIVRRLIDEFPSSGFIPPGDDCGAFELDERLLLFSIDTKGADTHFPTGFSDFEKGWSVAAANLSDIAAMGGVPVGLLIAYGVPRDAPFETVHDLQAGVDACLSVFSVPLLGGDTKESRCLTVTGAAVGIVDKREVLMRKGSRPGDMVCVTGPLGGAMLGLRSMLQGLGIRSAEERLRRPVPRIKEGRVLAMSGIVTSCMDISDGLSSSLYELMRASGYGFEVDEKLLPMHESLIESQLKEDDRLDLALHSGDEYELLFTTPEEGMDGLRAMLSSASASEPSVIGRVMETRAVMLRSGDRRIVLEDRGYEHFR